VTSGRGLHRPPRRRIRAAASAFVATAAVIVGITLATNGSGPDPSDAVVSPTHASAPVLGDRGASHSETRVRGMGRSAPTRLRIPAIGVDSGLMELGLRSDGSLEVPPDAVPAGWFTGAPTPGELGPAIIAGHVRWNGTAGVFEHLADLKVDDVVDIERQDGRTAVFRVTRVAHFAKSDFPTEAVYGDVSRPSLRLITCGGLEPGTNRYEQNVVVFAVIVS